MALPAGRYGVTKRQLNKVKNLPVNTIGMIEEAIETSEEYADNAIGWVSKNLGYHINKTLSGNEDDGFQIVDGGSSLIAKTDNNTQYVVSRKHGVGTRFRIILFKYEPSSTPSTDAVSVVFDNTLDTYTFVSGMYNYVVFTYDNAVNISQDTAEAMIELGSTATAYEPYHASVDESKCDNSVIAPVEDQATCQNPDGYADGEHFIRNRKFCTAITSIANGATLTLNTNYVEGTIAELLAVLGGTVSDVSPYTQDVNNTYLYKVGKLAVFNYRSGSMSLNAGSSIQIASLPIGFKPITGVYTVGMASGSKLLRVAIGIDGSVFVKSADGITNETVEFSITFITS